MGFDNLPTLADKPRRVRQKWEPDEHEQTRVEQARETQTADDANWRAVCQLVNVRDDLRCRCCGRRVNPRALSMLEKGHHHHVQYRSDLGEDTVENVCLLCADCHNDVHVKKTLLIEGNAEIALTFSRRDRESGQFYVWKQETALRVFERD